MFFTKFARVAASFIVVIAIANLGIAFLVADHPDQRIFANTGRAIDISFMALFAGLVLGVLSEISTGLRK